MGSGWPALAWLQNVEHECHLPSPEHFSTTRESMRIEDLLNPSDELWTEAPVESDEEDAALVEAIQVRAEEDQEDADDSVQHVPMSLKEARELFARGKTFVQDNQANPAMQKFLAPVEGLVRALEAMTFSSRTCQSAMTDFFPRVPDADLPEGAGAKAD